MDKELYNRKERKKIYKSVLKRIENCRPYDYFYLCNEIMYNRIGNIYGLFPEFELFRPVRNDKAWFNAFNDFPEPYRSETTKNAQKMILQFCIEMTNG